MDYKDYAPRNRSTKTDWLSVACILIGMIGLITFLLYLGALADAFMGYIEIIN